MSLNINKAWEYMEEYMKEFMNSMGFIHYDDNKLNKDNVMFLKLEANSK